MNPLLAIVGRPNVGKSTLFNRLVGRRLALVEDVPGVTRDRHYGEAEWEGRTFTVIDTGGFLPGEEDPLLVQVREQAQLAVEECDVILLVVDGRAGPTAVDEELARLLRRSGKPLLLGVNKLDTPRTAEEALPDFYRLGIEPMLTLSAEHALGTDALLDAVVARFPEVEPTAPPPDDEAPPPVRLAVIGRPNVGKSTLVNALLGAPRHVASPLPGTTRDPIDSVLERRGRHFVLTDTAGIRRKKAIAQRLETFSVVAALRAMERADVAVLLLDATEPGVDQDARLAGLVEEKGRALLLVVNKWDLVASGSHSEETFRASLKWELDFVGYAPILFVSALHGAKVEKVLDLGAQLFDQFHFRASTPALNRLLEKVVDAHPAPLADGRPLRLYYIAQVGTAPPAFAITCNRPEQVPGHYKRYLANQLRQAFGLKVPLRIFFRERPGRR